VFPLRPNTKLPALHSAAKCPGTGACAGGHLGWEQRATTDPDRIRAAWTAGPAYNIGLATGPSALVVIDLDTAGPDDTPPEEWNLPGVRDGHDVLTLLADQAGQPLPGGDTFTVATPSGGIHHYYRAPVGVELRNTAGTRLGWKVDTRAHGGYVVAAGSTINGRAYRVLCDLPPAPLPGWLTDRLTPASRAQTPAMPVRPSAGRRDRYLDAALREECRRVATTRTNRNATLYAAALTLGRLVAGNALPEDQVRAALLTAAGRHIGVRAFTETEAHNTINSGLRAGANKPRQVA
jgi:hypothetical protein